MDGGRVALVALLLCGVVAVVAGTLGARSPGGAGPRRAPGRARRSARRERAVLAALGPGRRSAAWARGDVGALRSALRRRARGAGAPTSRLLRGVRRPRAAGGGPADPGAGLVGGRAGAPTGWCCGSPTGSSGSGGALDGATRAPAAGDRPTERRLTLVRGAGRWLMARVT